MKILYLTPGCFDKGGISRYCRYQISALREIFGKESIRVISLLGPTDNSFEEKFEVWWSGAGNSINQKVQFTTFAIKESIVWQPDVVHSAHVNFSGFSHMLAKIGKTKTVLNIYGLEVWSGLSRDATYGLKNVEFIISDCHFTAEYIKMNTKLSAEKTEVIWDCVDLDKFSPGIANENVLKKYKISSPDQFFNIMTLGRLSSGASHKGYERLLNTFAMVSPQAPHARLIIAGSGDMSAMLEKKAEQLQINKKVIFTGPVHEKDLVDVYRAAHVFSLISDQGKGRGEGIPLTPLEAMACGVPILVGNQDGSREAIVVGRNGFCLDPFDIQIHVDTLMNLINNKKLLQSLSKGAFDVARDNFTYEAFKEKHLLFYNQLLPNTKGLTNV